MRPRLSASVPDQRVRDCIDSHAHDLRHKGVADEKLMLVPVWLEAGAWFTDRERAALAGTKRSR